MTLSTVSITRLWARRGRWFFSAMAGITWSWQRQTINRSLSSIFIRQQTMRCRWFTHRNLLPHNPLIRILRSLPFPVHNLYALPKVNDSFLERVGESEGLVSWKTNVQVLILTLSTIGRTSPFRHRCFKRSHVSVQSIDLIFPMVDSDGRETILPKSVIGNYIAKMYLSIIHLKILLPVVLLQQPWLICIAT